MRARLLTRGTCLVAAIGAVVALAGCDTNYYGDRGTTRSTTTTTETPTPPPTAAYPGETTTTTTEQQTIRH